MCIFPSAALIAPVIGQHRITHMQQQEQHTTGSDNRHMSRSSKGHVTGWKEATNVTWQTHDTITQHAWDVLPISCMRDVVFHSSSSHTHLLSTSSCCLTRTPCLPHPHLSLLLLLLLQISSHTGPPHSLPPSLLSAQVPTLISSFYSHIVPSLYGCHHMSSHRCCTIS